MRVLELSQTRLVLRLERGEKLMDTLRRLARERRIGAASLRGLGAAGSAELACYNLEQKRYESIPVSEPTEIAVLVGNLSHGPDGEPVAHVHGVLSRRDGSAVGGHVLEIEVSATLEIDLEVLPGTLRRQVDASIGLPLLAACGA